ANRVSLEQLADWAEGEDVQRRLASLCSLADAQAQFQLSRYRHFVAQNLMHDAMEMGGTELTRKARVDAMKAEVWQPYAPEAPAPPAAGPAAEGGDDADGASPFGMPLNEEGGADAPAA